MIERRVLHFLKTQARWVSLEEFMDAFMIGPIAANYVLKAMFRSGLIEFKQIDNIKYYKHEGSST
jgi:hypothetical protein